MDRGCLRISASAIALLASAALPAVAAERLEPTLFHDPVTVEAAYTRYENVNHGRDSEPRFDDDVLGVTLSQPRSWMLLPNVRLLVTGIVAGDKFARRTRLDRISGGVQADLQFRASGDFDAVTWSLVGRAAYDAFGSRLRSGGRYFLGVSAQRAVTDRIDVFAEAGRNERYGRSDVFNGRDDAVKLSLAYSLRARDLLYLTGQYRKGDTVSSGPASLANADLASVLVPDETFGPGMFSYRFEARTVFSTLGWNHALGPRESVDVSWRRIDSTPTRDPGLDVPGRLRYVSDQYAIVYLRRF